MARLKLGYSANIASMMANGQTATDKYIAQHTQVVDNDTSTVGVSSVARSSSTAMLYALAAQQSCRHGIFQPAKAILRHGMQVTVPRVEEGFVAMKDTWAPKKFEVHDAQTALRRTDVLRGVAARVAISRLPLASFVSIRNFVPDASTEDFVHATIAFQQSMEAGQNIGISQIPIAFDLMEFVPPADYMLGVTRSLQDAGIPITSSNSIKLSPEVNKMQLLEAEDSDYYDQVVGKTINGGNFGYKPPGSELSQFAYEHPRETSLIENELNPAYKVAMIYAAERTLGRYDLTTRIHDFVDNHTYSQ